MPKWFRAQALVERPLEICDADREDGADGRAADVPLGGGGAAAGGDDNTAWRQEQSRHRLNALQFLCGDRSMVTHNIFTAAIVPQQRMMHKALAMSGCEWERAEAATWILAASVGEAYAQKLRALEVAKGDPIRVLDVGVEIVV